MICKIFTWLAMASLLGSAHAGTVDESTIARTIYAKLHYATDLELVRAFADTPDYDHASRQGVATVPTSMLSIRITDVEAGNYSEIANRMFSDLVTPQPQTLAINLANHHYIDGSDKSETSIRSLQLRWTNSPFAKANWSMPVQDAVAIDQPGRRYTRYVHYTVTLTFDEQTVKYQSLILFEPNSDGKSGIRIIDPVVDVTALMAMLTYDPYPGAFINGPHKSTKAVQHWLMHGTGRCDYDAGSGVCCDLDRLTCRMDSVAPASDVSSNFGLGAEPRWEFRTVQQCQSCGNVPTIAPASGADSNTWDHVSGGHGSSWGIAGQCQIASSSTCNINCDASGYNNPWENGLTYLYSVHQFAMTSSYDHLRNVPASTQCKGGIGYGMKGCFLACGASIGISWNGATFTVSQTDTVWNNAQTLTFTCQ